MNSHVLGKNAVVQNIPSILILSLVQRIMYFFLPNVQHYFFFFCPELLNPSVHSTPNLPFLYFETVTVLVKMSKLFYTRHQINFFHICFKCNSLNSFVSDTMITSIQRMVCSINAPTLVFIFFFHIISHNSHLFLSFYLLPPTKFN